MTHFRLSFSRGFVALAGAALLAACGRDSTAPIDAGSDAARAAQTFAQLADSVTRNGGDPDVGNAYAGIAGIVRAGGRISPIVLTIDNVASTFDAAAMTFETTVNSCPKGAQCIVPPQTYVVHNLIAWDEKNPKRLVQLSSASNDEQIGAILDPSPLAIYARMASLIYMDGTGATFIGTSGTQKFGVTKSDTPCPVPADSGKVGYLRPNGTCTLADHAVSFSGTLVPSPYQTARGLASVAHTIAMSAQTVAGTRRTITIDNLPCDTACAKPPVDSVTSPPVVVRPSNELPAKLQATIAGDVSLTFTIANTTQSPVKVSFSSGQKYEFAVIDSTSGKEVWRWSNGKGFTASFVEQTVPANSAISFTEKWTPPSRGRYLAHAWLTSTSHRAEAYTTIVVP